MNIVLGVSGSISAYRAADLARELMRHGHTVRVCLTDAAQNFVSKVLFETLTGQPCLTDTFEEPISGRMAHIDWARQADLVLIAPATANTMNKIAAGVGDDMLTTIALVTTKPILMAPAMNPNMYANETVRNTKATLLARGVEFVEPTEGDVACGEHGQGKLATIDRIVEAVEDILTTSELLRGKRVVITSGPTQEPIDDVRYISNRSSGKMGSAMAKAALRLGADVTVIAGPQSEPLPLGATVISVKTALQMHEAAVRLAPQCDIFVGVAAVADYRLENPVSGKMRRSGDGLELRLIPNPDIIADVAKAAPRALVVGFAAEPTDSVDIAKQKIEKKGLFAIAANDISNSQIGFSSENNQIALAFRDGLSKTSGIWSKYRCAFWILEEIFAKSMNQTESTTRN